MPKNKVVKGKKVKRIEDFIVQRECFENSVGIGRAAWTIQDIFEMLDYLATEIEKLKNLPKKK